MIVWANEFQEILSVLPQREDLRLLIQKFLPDAMPGKVTEGGDRADRVRKILGHLVDGAMNLNLAYRAVDAQLERASSPHSADNRVFANGWGERLIRTQLSRFYNLAVLDWILAGGSRKCFVPISTHQTSARCSAELAGQEHEAESLYDTLVDCYTNGNWRNGLKVPEHPHCTHVVRPLRGD